MGTIRLRWLAVTLISGTSLLAPLATAQADPAIASSSQEPSNDELPLSPSAATWLSSGLTLAGAGVGAALLATEHYVPGALVAGFGIVVGPSVGRFFGKDSARAGWRILTRVLIAGVGYGFTDVTVRGARGYEGYRYLAVGAGITGSAILAQAAYDIATTPRDLRDNLRVRFALLPVVVGQTAAPGLGVVGTF